jgi:hypothetical protein
VFLRPRAVRCIGNLNRQKAIYLKNAEEQVPMRDHLSADSYVEQLLAAINCVDNWNEVVARDGVWRSFISPGLHGRKVKTPANNDSYLGHIVCVDTQGLSARKKSEELVAALELAYLDVD